MPIEAIDHLRRLDALFAEKVLGLVGTWCDGGCDALYKPLDRCEECGGRFLMRYTRSLDAAWEGATTVGFVSLDYYFDTGKTTANVDRSPDGEQGMTGSMDHPAEALVLACLRAVGVSEEEIDAK